MENVDVQKQVKQKRESTFGEKTEVGEVSKEALQKVSAAKNTKDTAALAKDAVQNLKDTMAKQANEKKPVAPQEVKLVKGFTVGVDEKGAARLVPFGSPSFLELIGLMRYTDSRQTDILHDLAMSKEARMQNQLVKLTEDVTVIANGVGALLTK